MASSPSSLAECRPWSLEGRLLEAPAEWQAGWLELPIPADAWDVAEVRLQGQVAPVFLRRLGGAVRPCVEWPRKGPGLYEAAVRLGGAWRRHVLQVSPRLLSLEQMEALLDELCNSLPAGVALSLQTGSALAGVRFAPPGASTPEQEWLRLLRAVQGSHERPGLLAILPWIDHHPHEVLGTEEPWVRRSEARRPHPTRLAQVLLHPANAGLPSHETLVLDQRSVASLDNFENRVVRGFVQEVLSRLRHLALVQKGRPMAGRAEDLGAALATVVEKAEFLHGLPSSNVMPRPTMVLMRRPSYRAAYEGWLELRKALLVNFRHPALAAPLNGLPDLYETWCTLHAIRQLVDAATSLGFRVVRQTLVRRLGSSWLCEVFPDGCPAAELQDGAGRHLRIVPQRVYGSAGDLRSLSYSQIPDLALELREADGSWKVWLLDPKYRLDASVSPARPPKDTIDKMHAYRDAIRDAAGTRVVVGAAILYPGPDVWFGDGISAVGVVPGRLEGLLRAVREAVVGFGMP